MPKILSISLIAIAFVLGTGFGYVFTPEYSAYGINADHKNGLGEPDKYLNLRYINGMIAHHLSAIYMLEQVKKESQRPELQGLADVVIELDTNGIEELYAFKKEMYGDTRKVKNFNKVDLAGADERFDLRFLNAMIIHHMEAIDSSREAMIKSSDKKILETAFAVDNLLSENMMQLEEWREGWYAVK